MHQQGQWPTAIRPTDAVAVAALLDLSPDAVLVVEQTGLVRQANELAADLFRCGHDRLLGLEVEALVPTHLRGSHRGQRAAFHRAPSRRSMGSGRRLRARRLDGTTFPVDISLQPISVADEMLVVAVIRDLTAHDELRRRNDELVRDADALRRFIDVASHELRTPLTSLLGFAETLQQQPDLEADLRAEILSRLVRNARREEALVSGLLDLSRFHNGKLDLSIDPVDLVTTVQELVTLFDGIDITCMVPSGTRVLADALRLEQILSNLLTNAVRYGQEPITIEAGMVDGSHGAQVWLRVRDQGPGIDEEFETALFRAFSQQSTGDRRDAAGLGLGLYLARELAAAMGGTITYDANEPTGSCFEVRLPAP